MCAASWVHAPTCSTGMILLSGQVQPTADTDDRYQAMVRTDAPAWCTALENPFAPSGLSITLSIVRRFRETRPSCWELPIRLRAILQIGQSFDTVQPASRTTPCAFPALDVRQVPAPKASQF